MGLESVMAWVGSLADGARLALMVGFTLAIVNGLWVRFSPSHNTLGQAIDDQFGKVRGG